MPSEALINNSQNFKRRIGLILQYKGTDFCGWQRQKNIQELSIQSVLEQAISSLDPFSPIKSVAAGRTDSGVHAAGQVVHFDYIGPVPTNSWPAALNGRLPSSIRIREAISMPLSWHACYSAVYRRYRYSIYNGCRPNLFLEPWTWHKYQVLLDEKIMELALNGLVGRHDFSAFQRTGSNRKDAFTTIQAVEIQREGEIINIEIQASGFLYGMVRLLVGQLVAIGEHKLSLETFERRWKEKRRNEIKESAPAKGLCFLRAGYKENYFVEPDWFDSFPKFALQSFELPQRP